MKTLSSFAFVFCAVAGVLRADPVITFDDLPSTFLPVPPGYHELNWGNIYYLNGVSYSTNANGFHAGVVSSSNVLYGGDFIGTSVISAKMFDFVSAYVTAAFNDNLMFEAKGYIKGTLVYDQTNLLSATTPTLVNFNFYGVDEVDLTSSNGTHHAAYSGTGQYFALDNLSVVTYVPYAPMFITNGGFETGSLSSWSHFGNTNDTFVTTNATFVHSGLYGVEIGPTVSNGYLSQFVAPTGIGQRYTVSCWLENELVGANDFGIIWGSGLIAALDLTNQPAFTWTNIVLNLEATRFSEFLEFRFLNGPSFFGFDDISVTPTVLVANGGFETGDFSGWTPSGNSGKDKVLNQALDRRSGSYGADFAASGSLGYISQTVTTYPGQPYLVSLWLDSPDGLAPNEFKASWGGQTLTDQMNMTGFGWTNLHFTVVNTNTQNTLQFGLRDDPTSLGLDEVSVFPIPILTNGGFEFGDFTGWTSSGNFTFSSVSTNTNSAFSGFYGGSFGPVTNLGYLSQTVQTLPGQAYLIAYMLNVPPSTTNSEFSVTWNGTVLTDYTNFFFSGWLPYEFLVTASGTTSTLQFGFRDDLSYLGLDAVSVSAISAPVFLSINKTTNVDLTWSSVPGYWYELQYKTNLSQSNWLTLVNFTPTANYTMSVTDTNPPNPMRFYRVFMAPPPLIE